MVERFGEIIREYPVYNRSFVLMEAYSVKAVQDVPARSTAFPHREDQLLLWVLLPSPMVGHLLMLGWRGVAFWYDTDPAIDERSLALGTELRDILQNGSGSSELRAYVNYASGLEGPKSWYGYEDWRQEKLVKLKKEWDPKGRFSFYNPILWVSRIIYFRHQHATHL